MHPRRAPRPVQKAQRMDLQNFAIVLASQSPRRQALLLGAGLDVIVCATHAAEDATGATPETQAIAIARQKLLALPDVVERLPPDWQDLPHIAADTMVVLGERILGKPADAAQAAGMLRALSGVSHRVVTGVALQLGSAQKTFAVSTEVRFRDLSGAAIDAYIATGEPFDKAGGYGIQGKGGHLVDEVHGSLSNVIGLPLAQTLAALERLAGSWRQLRRG